MRIKRIVIDVSSLLDVPFITGIQRVVREIVMRMISMQSEESAQVLLLAYSAKRMSFHVVNQRDFLTCFEGGKAARTSLYKGTEFSIKGLGSESILFDIDSVWNNQTRRSFLLPILKSQGVRVAVHIYDIIPILYPQYCDGETTIRFMDYLAAHLQCADLVIANTNSTIRDIVSLGEKLKLPAIPTICVPLGADMSGRSRNTSSIPTHISKDKTQLLRNRYFLAVGTIEPRKNHSFLLDTYQTYLREAGFSMVIVGRPGWNVSNLMNRITQMDLSDSAFCYIPNATDEEINYLYANAYFTVFPTFCEGFGLPIIESYLHGTPVLASDIPVLREVGGDLCDYFEVGNAFDLFQKVEAYAKDNEQYLRKRERLAGYLPVTWDQSAKMIWETLGIIE